MPDLQLKNKSEPVPALEKLSLNTGAPVFTFTPNTATNVCCGTPQSMDSFDQSTEPSSLIKDLSLIHI